MRIKILALLFLILIYVGCKETKKETIVFTEDVTNYWNAYDKIITTKDSILQLKYLNEEFINKASVGQKTMFNVRNCTPEEYLSNINNYPKFWKSIRKNTLKAKDFGHGIKKGLLKLKASYSNFKPAKVYFTVGTFRAGATAIDSLVMIGVEQQLGDSTVDTSEFPESFSRVKDFLKSNPIDNADFLSIHEFVHTQQVNIKKPYLLLSVVREGVAEFIAEKLSGITSTTPAVVFGKQHPVQVREVFEKEMFTTFHGFWLWNSYLKKLNHSDLGYYVGYAIAKKYYENATDKSKVIKELIDLDYNNEREVFKFVNASKYFDETVENQLKIVEKNRPSVVSIKEFNNNDTNVNPNIKTLTLEFSEPMLNIKNLRPGPLGGKHLLEVKGYKGWSSNKKSITYEIQLKPNLQQQLEITNIFQSERGYFLIPYLVDITTKNKTN